MLVFASVEHFLSVTECYSVVLKDQLIVIHSSAEGYLCSFHFGNITNRAVSYICVQNWVTWIFLKLIESVLWHGIFSNLANECSLQKERKI